MTKKLETLFNLDSKENTLKESTEIEGENDLKEPIIPVIEPEIPQKTLTNLAKIEESLTLVLEEIKNLECKKIVVIPKNDLNTQKAIENFNCKIVLQ